MKALLTSTGLALMLAISPGVGSSVMAESERFIESQGEHHSLASDLMNREVLGEDDESIGTVSDILIDDEGNVVAVVVGAGEFLGIGARDVAIGYDQLSVERQDDQLRITTDLTRSELEEAPEFERAAELAPDLSPPMPDTPGAQQPATPGDPAMPGGTPGLAPEGPAMPGEAPGAPETPVPGSPGVQ